MTIFENKTGYVIISPNHKVSIFFLSKKKKEREWEYFYSTICINPPYLKRLLKKITLFLKVKIKKMFKQLIKKILLFCISLLTIFLSLMLF